MSVVTHSIEFDVQTTWGRINALAWHYYSIAEDAYNQFLEAEENITPLPDFTDPTEHFAITDRLLSASFRTIVFSGMACEAAVYDLAAIQLGDNYTNQYLEKLDLLSKWIIIPSLICGKKLEEHGPAINSLRTLIRTRNTLVHSKSLPGIPLEEAARKAEGQLEKIVKETGTAFKAMILLSLELNEILGTPAGVLPFFEKNIVGAKDQTSSPRISKTIARCHEINAHRKA